MDRVGAGSIYAENLAVSIYGNIQPKVYQANLANLSADGLLQRFLPAILRANRTQLGHPVPDYLSSASAWTNTLRMVYALPAQVYRLSAGAYTVFREYQAWYEGAKADERLLNASTEYMTAFGKLEGTCGRLALVLHLIERPFAREVSAEIVTRVVDLVRGYLIPALRYSLSDPTSSGLDQWVADHIVHISGDTATVTLRELKRSARRQLEGMNEWARDQAILDAMSTLEQGRWVAQTSSDLNRHAASWTIHPALASLFADHRRAVIAAKQRHLDYAYRHATAQGRSRKLVKGFVEP